MSFRLHALSLFLTYPNCGAKQECFDFLRAKFGERLRFLLVAQETHASGEPHLHALVVLQRRCDFSSAQCLDFLGFHGDYQAARDVQASHDYCRKDDPEPLTFGELFRPMAERRSGRRERDEQWRVALSASTYSDFLAAAEAADPRDFIVNYDRIVAFGRQRFKSEPVPYADPFPDSWLPNTAMDGWALENITNWVPSQGVRPKSLILIGDSRLGKTAWARRFGEHIYFNGTWNMSKLDSLGPSTKYAVWDDLYNWESFNYKQWLGGQWEFDVTGKYRSPRTIESWGRPSIVCCNALPNHLDNQWVRDNCLIIHVLFRLFNQ